MLTHEDNAMLHVELLDEQGNSRALEIDMAGSTYTLSDCVTGGVLIAGLPAGPVRVWKISMDEGRGIVQVRYIRV